MRGGKLVARSSGGQKTIGASLFYARLSYTDGFQKKKKKSVLDSIGYAKIVGRTAAIRRTKQLVTSFSRVSARYAKRNVRDVCRRRRRRLRAKKRRSLSTHYCTFRRNARSVGPARMNNSLAFRSGPVSTLKTGLTSDVVRPEFGAFAPRPTRIGHAPMRRATYNSTGIINAIRTGCSRTKHASVNGKNE